MKLIPLRGKHGRGKFAKVDDADFEWLSKIPFHVRYDGYPATYMNGKARTMHQVIMPPKKKMHVDHINRDNLDNRRSNLRYVTPGENIANCIPRCPSGVKGVYLRDKSKNFKRPWAARAKYNNRFYHLGVFATVADASNALKQFWKAPEKVAPPVPQLRPRPRRASK